LSQNIYIGASFMSPVEAADAVRRRYWTGSVGLGLPTLRGHFQYAYPGRALQTKLALRHAFHATPGEATGAMVGGNAIEAYNLDRRGLEAVARKIQAPSLDELTVRSRGAPPARLHDLPNAWSLELTAHRPSGSRPVDSSGVHASFGLSARSGATVWHASFRCCRSGRWADVSCCVVNRSCVAFGIASTQGFNAGDDGSGRPRVRSSRDAIVDQFGDLAGLIAALVTGRRTQRCLLLQGIAAIPSDGRPGQAEVGVVQAMIQSRDGGAGRWRILLTRRRRSGAHHAPRPVGACP